MKTFHFITAEEHRAFEKLMNTPAFKGKSEIETLLEQFPEARDGSEEFFLFLEKEHEAEVKYEKETGNLYCGNKAIVPAHIEEWKHGTGKTVLFCLERLIGQMLFDEWFWNLPTTQEAYTKTKVAGVDWYKQFESNPDAKADHLDNLKDRNTYGSELKKIELGEKHGKYENGR